MSNKNSVYAITGATGMVGRVVALNLLEAGKEVRIISRNAEKAKELTDKGAKLFIGETTDIDLLNNAFNGVDAVFAMTPANYLADDFVKFQLKHINTIAQALKNQNIKYVVSMSALGAHLESGMGTVTALHTMEKQFDQIDGLNTLHLRATYFMENTFGMIGLIKEVGVMGSPIKGETSFPIIATVDIGAYAANRLSSLDFEGKNTQDLLGSRDVTFNEITQVFGAAIGKPDMTYVDMAYEDFKKAMIGNKIASENLADHMNELIQGINNGKFTEKSVRNTESTTPTTIEAFAEIFANVYNMN